MRNTTFTSPQPGTVRIHAATAAPTTPGTSSRIGWTAMAALAPMVWGTTFIVTTHMLPEGHPLFAALMRALPAGLIALLIARQLPRGSWWWKSLVLGTLNMAAFFPLLFLAAQRLPGGVAATLAASQPIVVAVLAVLVLREKMSAWRIIWAAVGMGGIALIVLGPDAGLDPLGVLAGVGCALSVGAGLVLTKKWGRPDGVSAVGYAGWQLTAAGVVLLLPALLIDGIPAGIDTTAALGYAWMGLVGGLLTYTLWFTGMRHIPVTAAAMLSLLTPIVAATLGAVIAGEALTPVQMIGFAVALTALMAGQVAPSAKKVTTTAPSTPLTLNLPSVEERLRRAHSAHHAGHPHLSASEPGSALREGRPQLPFIRRPEFTGTVRQIAQFCDINSTTGKAERSGELTSPEGR